MSTSITYRQATHADTQLFVLGAKEIWDAGPLSVLPFNPLHTAAYASRVIDGGFTEIAEHEGKPIGGVAMIADGPDGALLGQEVFHWVDSAHRGNGIGRELMGHAIAWAKDQGCAAVIVTTQGGNSVGVSGFDLVESKHMRRI